MNYVLKFKYLKIIWIYVQPRSLQSLYNKDINLYWTMQKKKNNNKK